MRRELLSVVSKVIVCTKSPIGLRRRTAALCVAWAVAQDTAYALKAKIFFATPYHAWERGLNENTNGLIRDFFPKGTDFATIANAEVAKVERLLNARPRKSLGFRSPREVFNSLAHS